jgi:hypothetical protein
MVLLMAAAFVAFSPLHSNGSCDVATKKDCGFSGIDQAGCVAKGCCWVPHPGEPWCFFSSSPAPSPGPHPPPPPPPPPAPHGELPGCEIYHDNQCIGNTITTNTSMEQRVNALGSEPASEHGVRAAPLMTAHCIATLPACTSTQRCLF